MNIKEKLQNDGDLKRACHIESLQSLELALEALGIPKVCGLYYITPLHNIDHRRQFWGWEWRSPRFWDWGSWKVAGGSWTGRAILL